MARVSLRDVTQFLAVAGLSIALGTGCTFESDGEPGPVGAPSFDYDDIDVGDEEATLDFEAGHPATAPHPMAAEIVAFADNPTSVAASSDGVYWTDASTAFDSPSSVMGQSATGSAAVEFSSHYGYAVGLVAHAGFLYWADVQNGVILSAPGNGGDAVTVVDGLQAPYAVTADDRALYWTDIEAGTIMSYDFATGSVVRLAKDQDVPAAIAVGSTAVIWTDLGSGAIRAVPKLGGSWLTLVSGVALGTGLAVDDNHIYYGDLLGQSIVRLSMADGSVEVIAEDQVGPGSIAIDGRSLVWTTQDYGTINEMRTSGGAIREIATQQADPDFLVAQGGNVYWASVGDGAVWQAGLAY